MSLLAQDFLPHSTGELVKHSYYSLSYSETHEQAEWVYYKLYTALLSGGEERSDNFRPDNKVSTGSAQLQDYKGSGYDRGHLCPAGSMKINSTAMSESFYLSNMSPQVPSFNRGIWKSLEDQVRGWVTGDDTLHVITGPVFKNNQGAIGPNGVTVPGLYFKAVYVPSKGKMVGLLLPNAKGTKALPDYCVTIDSLEVITGIDFFPQLTDDVEDKLEGCIDIALWDFSNSSKAVSGGTAGMATQCQGIAKSTGVQCKNNTNNTNGYCHVHQSQTLENQKHSSSYHGQCCATTKAGTRCKRNASGGSKYCWQHQ